jgi:hypothetical protein
MVECMGQRSEGSYARREVRFGRSSNGNYLETIFHMNCQAGNEAFVEPGQYHSLRGAFAVKQSMFADFISLRCSPRPGFACPFKILSAVACIVLGEAACVIRIAKAVIASHA